MKRGRRRVAHKRGKQFEEEVARIASDLPLPPEMPLRQKMDAIERYLIDHPRTAAVAVCMAAGVRPATYGSHVNRNKRGNTLIAKHYRTMVKLIELMHPDKGVIVRTESLYCRIKALGHKLSYVTLRKLLRENGYSTRKTTRSA